MAAPTPSPAVRAPAPAAPLRSGWLPFLIYTVLTVAAAAPTFRSYMWGFSHEAFGPLARLGQMVEIWHAGGPLQAPWLPGVCFGYGWPFFTYYAPLGYYVAGAATLTAIDLGAAVRLSFYATWFIGGAGMFWLVWQLSTPQGSNGRRGWWACLAAIVFNFAPYHHADIFVRASLAESWAFALLPWVFGGFELLRRPGTIRRLAGLLFTSAALALLMLSHNITALYSALALAVWVPLGAALEPAPAGAAHRRAIGASLAWAALAGALALALSAFCWVPALALKKLVAADEIDKFWGSAASLKEQALYFRQWFLEQYGTGISHPGPADEFAVNPGLAVMAGLALGLAAAMRRETTPALRRRLLLIVTLAGAALLATTWIMPWEIVPALLRYIQLPWRLLLFVVFFGALCWGLAGPLWLRRLHPLALILPLAAITIFAVPRRALELYDPGFSDGDMWTLYYKFEEKKLGKYAGSIEREYRPRWVDPRFTDPKYLVAHPPPHNRLEPLGPAAQPAAFEVLAFKRRGATYDYRYRAAAGTVARAHLFDFPGWQLMLDGRPAAERLARGPEGLLELHLPAGEHAMTLRYAISPLGRQMQILSQAAAALWLILAAAWLWKRKDWPRRPAADSQIKPSSIPG